MTGFMPPFLSGVFFLAAAFFLAAGFFAAAFLVAVLVAFFAGIVSVLFSQFIYFFRLNKN
jgi:hypothetical protein